MASHKRTAELPHSSEKAAKTPRHDAQASKSPGVTGKEDVSRCVSMHCITSNRLSIYMLLRCPFAERRSIYQALPQEDGQGPQKSINGQSRRDYVMSLSRKMLPSSDTVTDNILDSKLIHRVTIALIDHVQHIARDKKMYCITIGRRLRQ